MAAAYPTESGLLGAFSGSLTPDQQALLDQANQFNGPRGSSLMEKFYASLNPQQQQLYNYSGQPGVNIGGQVYNTGMLANSTANNQANPDNTGFNQKMGTTVVPLLATTLMSAAMTPAVGAAIGGGALGAIGGGAASGIMNAAMTGNNIAKGAVGGAVGGALTPVSSGISSAAGGGLLGDALGKATTGAIGSAVGGANPISGAVGGALGSIGSTAGSAAGGLIDPSLASFGGALGSQAGKIFANNEFGSTPALGSTGSNMASNNGMATATQGISPPMPAQGGAYNQFGEAPLYKPGTVPPPTLPSSTDPPQQSADPSSGDSGGAKGFDWSSFLNSAFSPSNLTNMAGLFLGNNNDANAAKSVINAASYNPYGSNGPWGNTSFTANGANSTANNPLASTGGGLLSGGGPNTGSTDWNTNYSRLYNPQVNAIMPSMQLASNNEMNRLNDSGVMGASAGANLMQGFTAGQGQTLAGISANSAQGANQLGQANVQNTQTNLGLGSGMVGASNNGLLQQLGLGGQLGSARSTANINAFYPQLQQRLGLGNAIAGAGNYAGATAGGGGTSPFASLIKSLTSGGGGGNGTPFASAPGSALGSLTGLLGNTYGAGSGGLSIDPSTGYPASTSTGNAYDIPPVDPNSLLQDPALLQSIYQGNYAGSGGGNPWTTGYSNYANYSSYTGGV